MLTTGSFKVKSGYLTAFLLLLFSYLLIFYTLQQLLKKSERVEHTATVINTLSLLMSNLNEAESGARGYVIKNDEEMLQKFYSTTKNIDSLTKSLEALTSDNIVQQRNTDTLKMLIQDKLGRIYRGVLLYKQSGSVITEDIKENIGIGIQQMRMIKNNVENMAKHEKDLFTERKERFNKTTTSIKVITVTSLIIALVLCIYSFVIYSKEYKGKSKADEQAVSYRQQLEKKVGELQQANAELQDLRSIEKFAATGRVARTIAHEIRNPLTNIALATEQIKAEAGENEEMNMLLDMINRNGQRINRMITELLNSTKFALLEYSKMEINDLMDETLELAKDRLELKNIKLQKDYGAESSEVVIDIAKMKIAFLNIIVNAIEAMEESKGTLKIKTSRIADKCVVEIIDNGAGMDENTLQKIFEPYFTNKDEGTGLGLTNTQNIILNHGGSIAVNSEPGEGTSFIITLSPAE
jgi:signal transduction histidine kinase